MSVFSSISDLFLSLSIAHRSLLSFPTRRSSDLLHLVNWMEAYSQPAQKSPYELDDHEDQLNGEMAQGRPQNQHYLRSGSHRSDRKSTRLNSSHLGISYAVFCLKKKKQEIKNYNI